VPRHRVVAAALLAALMLVAADCWAHAVLVRSAPPARVSLTRSPARVQLWFNERLEPAYSKVSVWGDDGRQVDSANGTVDAGEPTRLSVGVPPLPPGTYTVKFRVLSVDGHLVESSFPFTVRARR
jgi:copper resistance protein C